MNKDLAETINELGPSYREMVCEIQQSNWTTPSRRLKEGFRRACCRGAWGLVAAIALALVAIVVLRGNSSQKSMAARINHSRSFDRYTLALGSSPQAVDRICTEQLPDGSWGNDFLTIQNAAALRECKEAQAAYKRALRYLRSKGLKPLSRQELDARRTIARFQ